MMNFTDKLISIDPSKNCLKFLASRVLSDNYRGMQISQHNRYTADDLIVLLENIYKLVGNSKMVIRTTDLSKRSYNLPEEYIYAEYVNKVSSILGRCTQDSVRKNLFVDLHRMGLIDRYNDYGEKIYPYEKSKIKYVSITEEGKEFIDNKNNLFTKNRLYTKAIDILTKGLASELFEVARVGEKGEINIYEFMFFLSFMGCELNGQVYTRSELTEYLYEYKSMSKFQKATVINIVENYCRPQNFSGNKINKRDFGNWKNESQQIFMLMKDSIFFELRNETLHIRFGQNAIYENDIKFKRSIQAKQDYYTKHNIDKKLGFELHHIIPLLFAKNHNAFDVLDSWENMIYIDGYTHNKISQTNNKNYVLEFNDKTLILKDGSGNLDNVICEYDINVKYDPENKIVMLNYNTNILNELN